MVVVVAGTWVQSWTDRQTNDYGGRKTGNGPPRRDESGRDAEAMLYTARKVIASNTQKGVAAVVPTHRASSLLLRPPSSTYPRRTSSPCSATPISTARS